MSYIIHNTLYIKQCIFKNETILHIMSEEENCEYADCQYKRKKESNMCGYHKKYHGLDLTQYKFCTRCEAAIELSHPYVRCDKCNEENRKTIRKTKYPNGICKEIKKDGKVCGCRVIHIEEKLCKRHFKLLELKKNKEEEKKKNIRRCNSHYMCDGKNKGIKSILPEDYPYEKCLNCRNRNRPEEEKYEDKNTICIGLKLSDERCQNLIAHKKEQLCGSHYKSLIKNQQQKQDKDNNIIRCNSRTNCGLDTKGKAILPNGYEFKRCVYCREKERRNSDERKKKLIVKKEENSYFCVGCEEDFENKEEFLNSKGKYGIRCKKCREKRADKERNRDRKGRNVSEQVKKTKKIWRLNNPDEVRKYLDKHRQSNKYKNRNEERNRILREYRKKNPEKFQEYNEKRKQDVEYKLSYYKNRAKEKEYEWSISDEYALQLFSESCFYCDEFNVYNINGIDRVDNKKGYIENNAVSCCTICNMIKCEMSIDDFLNKVEHILTFHGFIEGTLFKFENDSHKSYRSKIDNANLRCILFDLTEEQFNEISKKSCYICGKNTNEIHYNGIDRVDNDKGYIIGNTQACCGNCNYMKGNLKLEEFIFKLYKIYFRKYKKNPEKDTKFKLDFNLKFKEILENTENSNNDIHPRRKIKNEKLDKLINDNKQWVNIGSLNVIICKLYKKLESDEITIEDLINEVKIFIKDSKERKEEKEKNKNFFNSEIEEICKPYKKMGKFRQFLNEYKKQIINQEITQDVIKKRIQDYIKNNITKQDKFEFCEEIQKLIKKYKKHGKFVKWKNRYRKKVFIENINEEQQIIDINEYIEKHINIYDYEIKKN